MNLNQLTITATDVKASVAFYQKLGLQLIVNALPRYARLLCPNGTSTFSVHYVEKLKQENNITIYFEVANIETTVNELMEKGIVFSSKPTLQSWLWYEASLYDPDGHKIIIYHAGENRINPPWRIN